MSRPVILLFVLLLATLGVVAWDAIAARRSEFPAADGKALQAMAGFLQAAGDSAGALAVYNSLLDDRAGFSYARLRRAAILYKLERYAQAESEYRSMLSGGADSPVAEYNLALTLLNQGRRADAAVYLANFAAKYADLLPDRTWAANWRLKYPAFD